jgi:hypothetical protein
MPVEQSMAPSLHGLGLEPQLAPALHETQLPEPLHTWPEAQLVPAGAKLVPSRQTAKPEVQSVRPMKQGAPGLPLHGVFATHGPQLPAGSQTCPPPHMVPAGRLAPFTHC